MNVLTDSAVAPAITAVSSELTSVIPLAAAVGAVVIAATVGWKVAKRFFS